MWKDGWKRGKESSLGLFGGGGEGKVFNPPSAVLTVEISFEWFGIRGDVGFCDVVGLKEAP